MHGSHHGAWCWDLLRPELERLGHRVINLDMPIAEPGLRPVALARLFDSLA